MPNNILFYKLALWVNFYSVTYTRPTIKATRLKANLPLATSTHHGAEGMKDAIGTRGSIGLERVMGIEPTSKAWEALVLPLNYTRKNMDSTMVLALQTTIPGRKK